MTSWWDDVPGMPEALQRVSGIIMQSSVSPNQIIAEGLTRLFSGDGKMLRPGMLLIAADFGKRQDKHYRLAAALEMLHMASLVHDDIVDDSPMRRGLPAAHTVYGRRDAVLIGDYLLSRCLALASEDTSPDNAKGLARAIAAMCVSEITENNDRFRANPSLRNYLRKIAGKSAMLFALALYVGAYEAKAPRELCSTLRRAGYDIGMAFQIIDDILDYIGDEKAVRKPLGNDIKTGIVTLPVLCALRSDDHVRAIFTRGGLPAGSLATGSLATGSLPAESAPAFTPEDAQTIFAAVRSDGAIEAAKGYAKRYTDRAVREIARLPDCPARGMLEALTRRLLERGW